MAVYVASTVALVQYVYGIRVGAAGGEREASERARLSTSISHPYRGCGSRSHFCVCGEPVGLEVGDVRVPGGHLG